jgi:hypothetical protein
MKLFYLAIFLISANLFLLPKSIFAQTYSTSSKSCGSCHQSVSAFSKIGDYCPHCHVRWGYENTHTTRSTITKKRPRYTPDYHSNSNETGSAYNNNNPVATVNKFLTCLGNQDFTSAYQLTNNRIWWTYESFASMNSYGGITNVDIYKLSSVSINKTTAQIKAYYKADDPINGDGVYLQYFYLKKFNSGWKIIKTKLIAKE